MTAANDPPDWRRFDALDFEAAAARIAEATLRTPLAPLPSPDPRLEVRGKLENRQRTGAFKARGAWNNVCQLSAVEREAGVVAASSGNHGRALAWAASRAGVPATIVMPEDAYPNKIEACRAEGADVVLTATREAANAVCEALVAEGRVLVHPYDEPRTIEGAGTLGQELAEQWPQVEAVLVPVGGGGLAAGTSLALRRRFGARLAIYAVEPTGAPTLSRALAVGKPVTLEAIETEVQGLCPPNVGHINTEICATTLDGVLLVDDEAVFAAQAVLVGAGETVEPAGAASWAGLAQLPATLLEGRGPGDPLRVCVVLSGANADPAQLARLAEAAR